MKGNSMTWARIEWDGGNSMTGPTEAIKAFADELEDKGIGYVMKAVRLGKPKKRTTKKKVADLDLEVRDTE